MDEVVDYAELEVVLLVLIYLRWLKLHQKK